MWLQCSGWVMGLWIARSWFETWTSPSCDGLSSRSRGGGEWWQEDYQPLLATETRISFDRLSQWLMCDFAFCLVQSNTGTWQRICGITVPNIDVISWHKQNKKKTVPTLGNNYVRWWTGLLLLQKLVLKSLAHCEVISVFSNFYCCSQYCCLYMIYNGALTLRVVNDGL